MAPVTKKIRRGAARCYAAFCEARLLTAWVPGLRSARVLRTTPEGLPAEVHFSFGEVRTYSLVYAYDSARRRVEWRSSAGVAEGVRGWAEFADSPEGCEMTYALESGAHRGAGERELGQPQVLVEAFARFMESGPP